VNNFGGGSRSANGKISASTNTVRRPRRCGSSAAPEPSGASANHTNSKALPHAGERFMAALTVAPRCGTGSAGKSVLIQRTRQAHATTDNHIPSRPFMTAVETWAPPSNAQSITVRKLESSERRNNATLATYRALPWSHRDRGHIAQSGSAGGALPAGVLIDPTTTLSDADVLQISSQSHEDFFFFFFLSFGGLRFIAAYTTKEAVP